MNTSNIIMRDPVEEIYFQKNKKDYITVSLDLFPFKKRDANCELNNHCISVNQSSESKKWWRKFFEVKVKIPIICRDKYLPSYLEKKVGRNIKNMSIFH